MLWIIIFILIVLWALGFFGGVGGSIIHLLLAIALIVIVLQIIQSRR